MSISVLMSVYKAEQPEYLDSALRSIWTDQTLRPDEIILIEDGDLTDGLHNVIKKWTDNGAPLVILKNQQNLGLTKSLNIGISKAKGDYIARMDSDDISLPSRFRLQVDFLDSHPDISIVGGSMQEFDSENDNLCIRRYPVDNEDAISYIYKASPLAHPAVMMRKSIFDDGLKYNENYRTSQDIALWYDVIIAGYKIANLKDIIIKFRRDDDMFGRRSKSKAKNEFVIYMKGIRKVYGFTWLYIFPIARYLFRLMPVSLIKKIYSSRLRRLVLNK